ncbi:hypothetical protein HAX54_032721, partial [Datura stramonium]|nr:hypothetical protein [Datura stramonium]
AMNEAKEMKQLFNLYGFGWITRTPDNFSTNMVREFCANYLTTIENQTLVGKKVKEKPRLESLIVRGWAVDVLEQDIARMLYGPDYQTPTSIAEFDHHIEAL